MTYHYTPIDLEVWDSTYLHCPFCFHWKEKEFSGLIWTTKSPPQHSWQVLLWVHLSALGVTLSHSDSSNVEAMWTVSAEVGLTTRETRTQNFGFSSTSLTWPPEWSFKTSVLICHIFFRSFQICPCTAKCKQLVKPTVIVESASHVIQPQVPDPLHQKLREWQLV